MCLLSKVTFNKTVGIEPLLIKNFIGNLPMILQSATTITGQEKIILNIIKTLGTYYSLAALVPNKMSYIYKTLTDIQLH